MTSGVAQGYSLSPTQFNLTLQTALDKHSRGRGCLCGGLFMHYLAFTENKALVAHTRTSLQLTLTTLLNKENQSGLEPGINKCTTMSICMSGGAWYVNHSPFTYTANPLLVVGPDQFYKYCGVAIGCRTSDEGRHLSGHLQDALNWLQGDSLRKQQKLWGLKRVFIPRFIHTATFSDPTKTHSKNSAGRSM